MKIHRPRKVLLFITVFAFFLSSCVLLDLFSTGSSNTGAGNTGESGGTGSTSSGFAEMTKLEKAVLDELNLVRKNPSDYATKYIEPMKKQFNGKIFTGYGYNLMTNEGVSAVTECVSALQSQSAKPALTASVGLIKAAHDWVSTQGPTGTTGHGDSWSRIQKYGTYSGAAENISYGFNDARKIVCQLLIDDGVSNRGHRKNIFGNYTHVGIGCGSHKTYNYMCDQDFATNYKEK